MARLDTATLRSDHVAGPFVERASDPQIYALCLMMLQEQRGDQALFDVIWAYARTAQAGPEGVVAFDLGLIKHSSAVCSSIEHATWAAWLNDRAGAGDIDGHRQIEALLRRRLGS